MAKMHRANFDQHSGNAVACLSLAADLDRVPTLICADRKALNHGSTSAKAAQAIGVLLDEIYRAERVQMISAIRPASEGIR